MLRQGLYGNEKTELQDFSRIFSFFKDSISSQLCITQSEKCTFIQPDRNEKAHSISLILTPVIKTGTTAQLNRIEYEFHLALRRVSCDFTQFFAIFTQFIFVHPINLKGLVVFLYFSKTNSYFQG